MEINKSSEQFKVCDICKINATSLCFKCNSYFCDSCFKFVHEKKNNIGHKSEEIDLFIPFEARCSIHPDIPMNLFKAFCIIEKEYAACFANF